MHREKKGKLTDGQTRGCPIILETEGGFRLASKTMATITFVSVASKNNAKTACI